MDSIDNIRKKCKNIEVLSEEPLIFAIDNFLTEEECEHFIDIAKPNMKRAFVSDNKVGVFSAGRTGSNTWIKHNTDKITKKIAMKVSIILKIPMENAESFQAIHYDVSQRYNQHYDGYKKEDTEKCKRCLKYGGQRIVTALLYLNDVEEGGGTSFPNLNIISNAKKGKMIVFENCIKGTTDIHPNSLHAGMPVIKGEKYAINLWFREMNCKKEYDFPFLLSK